MFNYIKAISLGLLLILTDSARLLPVQAEESALTVDQLVQVATKSNPEIQAAESRYKAALARPNQMAALPDPLLSFVSRNGNGNPLPFTELGKDPLSSVGIRLEQEIPYPGKLKLSGRIAQKEAQAASAQVEAIKWRIISQVKRAFYEYARSVKVLQILRESDDLLKRLESIAQSRYSVGLALQQDVLRSQLEISILNQRTTVLEREQTSALAEINRILNRSVDATLPPPSDLKVSNLPATFEAVHQEFVSRAPAVLTSEAMLEREKLSLNLARKQNRPDFMTSVEYANSPAFPDMWEIEFGVRIPIFYNKKQRYGVTESLENLNRAQAELKAAQQDVAFIIKNEFLQIEASQKLLTLYDKGVIPQSNLALESALASYQVGKADFLTTISNFLTLLEYRMNYLGELAKHESAIARLEEAIGRSLANPIASGGQNHE